MSADINGQSLLLTKSTQSLFFIYVRYVYLHLTKNKL